MTTTTEGCYILDCPFDEKKEAKSLGAKWDGKHMKKWYVPQELSNQIHKFPKRWNPKLYLSCTFEEKDHVKKAGAKWDRHEKRWYITQNQKATKFAKWLVGRASAVASPAPSYASHSSTQYDSGPTSRGNAEMAKLPMISSKMTLSQLQEECRYRGVRGFSNKKKDWLLDTLGLGTIWQSERALTPRINSNMTLIQLQKECRHRGVRGFSNKKKDWLLDTLGLGTVWQSIPMINSNMTLSQLQEECRHRGVRGFSNKRKDWLLDTLGLETIWQSENVTNPSAGPMRTSKNQRNVHSTQASSERQSVKPDQAEKGDHRSAFLMNEGLHPYDEYMEIFHSY
jgi:hypothetical protein